MATEFELLIECSDSEYAARASRAAFDELDRLESLLSRFIPNSDIARINSLKKGQAAIVSPETMECLQLAQEIHRQTGGLFDVTVGGLVDLWKESVPPQPVLQRLVQRVGMRLLEIRADTMSIRVHSDNLCLDLGGLGKGYALKKMAEVLREWKIVKALIHGGSSSILAMEPPAEEEGWKVRLTNPITQNEIRTLRLANQALSCSGLRRGADMIRPDCGLAVQDKDAVWVKGDCPAVCDGLSTAVMVMTRQEIERFSRQNPRVSLLVLLKDQPNEIPLQYGFWGEK
jgi:thiamine biosynthesis lipoprotein